MLQTLTYLILATTCGSESDVLSAPYSCEALKWGVWVVSRL